MPGAGWIDRYCADGFAVIRGVFPPAEVAELSRYFDEVLARAICIRELTTDGLAEFRVIRDQALHTLADPGLVATLPMLVSAWGRKRA